MNLFKKKKILFIIIIIICGIAVMQGRTIVIKKWSDALGWGKAMVAKRGTGVVAQKGLFGGKVKEVIEETIPVRVTKAVKMDYKDIITSFGTIKGFGEIPIKFKESGTVLKFYFKEGGTIKEDELVVSQEQKEEKLRVEYAEIEFNKNRKLYELGAITQDRFRQSELELESARLAAKKRNFYAPADGLMGTRKAGEGELVEPNDTVATFLDINNVFCEVGIIEKEMDKVKVGQKVKVTLDSFSNKDFNGTVDSVSPMIEGRSRTQTVRILVPNEEYLIKPGMFAKAEIITFEKKDALVVARKALAKTESGYAVFGVVREEEVIAKIIPVKVQRATEELALISEGLTEGQEIVLESPKAKESIKDGSKIEIIGEE